MKFSYTIFLCCILYTSLLCLKYSVVQAQAGTDTGLLNEILAEKPEYFKEVLNNAEKYEIQILYTQINRDANNKPEFRSYSYRVDPLKYFYPASTMKLPVALMAVEKINNLGISGLSMYNRLAIDSAFERQKAVKYDSTSKDYFPSIAHYIKKLFLVSDNDANNRLYEFVGQKELNQGLHKKGYEDLRLIHRLSYSMTKEQNRHTNPFRIYGRNNKVVYAQKAAYNDLDLSTPFPILKGKGYAFSGDSIVYEPKDFSTSNFISLQNLQDILKAVVFHNYIPEKNRFRLTAEDRLFFLQYMSQLPGETTYPQYKLPKYYDSYVKFFMFGDNENRMPDNIRIFNKVGLANGYFLDNAYVVDFNNKVEFLLSAVIYVNENEIFDGKYQYDEVGFPFLSKLGQVVYDYELKRDRKHAPDLSEFKIKYDKDNKNE